MKKVFGLFFALLLLLSLFGCAEPNSDSTEASNAEALGVTETTLPTEPPATTEPQNAELHGVALSQEILEEIHFEQCAYPNRYSYQYLYTGDDPVIHIPGGVTLTLPDEWLDHVMIIWHQDSEDTMWEITIDNTAVVQAWAAYHKGVEEFSPEDESWKDYFGAVYTLKICGISKDWTNVVFDSRGYLGENEDYIYFFSIPDFWGTNPDNPPSEHWGCYCELIDAIGEEAYWELVGDLVVTEDMARQMITINDPVE